MKNVTISMDEKLLELTRSEAAKAGVSVSDYIADIIQDKLDVAPRLEKSVQSQALERILAGPMWDITENGRMPTSDERNARRWHE